MRISSFLFCVLSVSLVSGIPVVLYNDSVAAHNGTVENVNISGSVVEAGPLFNETDHINVVDISDHSGRKLLRRLRVPSPPPPAPKAAPKAAPVPAPAPKAAPVPAPAPKAAPKAAPVPAPAPNAAPVAVTLSVSSSKSAPVPAPAHVSVPTPKPAPAPGPVTLSAPASPPAPVLPVSAKPTPQNMNIFMTCDNEFHLYINGVKVGQGNSWTTTYKFSPTITPGDVIALDGIDHGGPAAFIGVFNGKVTKATEWKCSTKETSGWNKNSFDDSSWSKAISYGRNEDNNVWRSVGGSSRPNIPGDAEWLWTSNNNDHNRVYCRYFPLLVSSENPESKRSSVAASPAPVVAAASQSVSSKTVVDEISNNKKKSNQHISSLQSTIMKIIKENNEQQKKLQDENRNSYNGASITLQNAENKLSETNNEMKKLYDESYALNMTIQRHYKKLIADSDYLHSLDVLRPTFLKSLDELNKHIQGVKSTVETKLIKDEYKDEMVNILSNLKFNTHNISGYLSDYFVKHYNKYKALLNTENINYLEDLKRLNSLAAKYRIESQKSADLALERAKLEAIVKNMKETYILTVEQQNEFDLLVKDIMNIFDNKKC